MAQDILPSLKDFRAFWSWFQDAFTSRNVPSCKNLMFMWLISDLLVSSLNDLSVVTVIESDYLSSILGN